MKDNKYETKHDYETELAELKEREAHDLEQCHKYCPYCLEEYERDKVEMECEK